MAPAIKTGQPGFSDGGVSILNCNCSDWGFIPKMQCKHVISQPWYVSECDIQFLVVSKMMEIFVDSVKTRVSASIYIYTPSDIV